MANPSPAIFENAFITGYQDTFDSDIISFKSVNLGNLKSESGRLVVWDPVTMFRARPLIQQFPVGSFPVELALATTNKYEVIAFSRIVFSDSSVNHWSFARIEGQDSITIFGDEIYGIGVDAGIILYVDSVGLVKLNEETNFEKQWNEIFMPLIDQQSYFARLHAFDPHNLATFSSGMGDGFYASYIGYDRQGNVCQLLTDFNIIDWLVK